MANGKVKETRVNKYKNKYNEAKNVPKTKKRKTEEDLKKEAIEVFDCTEIWDITKFIDGKNKKRNNFIAYAVIVISVGLLLFSGYKIFMWNKDNIETTGQIEEIQEQVTISDIEDSENVEIIEPVEVIDKENPYWDYIKMNLIDVDFQTLKETNNQTVGWIQVLGTNINYPFVQTDNNDYYLKHSFDKSYNNAGWVFLDYRNNLNMEEKNTILYAHGRQDKTMFGSLKNILSSDWLKNTDNYVVKLSTSYENTLWQVFSIYHIPTTSDYLYIDFNNDSDFVNFANMLKDRSTFDFNTIISENDRILTLSTCYNLTDKVVLHAKLIKREVK